LMPMSIFCWAMGRPWLRENLYGWDYRLIR
jgi:hypothetical protein